MNGRISFGMGMVILCLLGLVMASRAVDDTIYISGLLLFVFGVINIFVMIYHLVGHHPGDGRAQDDGPDDDAA